jgi:hypothetical protein
MKKHLLLCLYIVVTCISCKNNTDTVVETTIPILVNKGTIAPSKAITSINQAIKAHGGDLYETADYSFVFRQKNYRFVNNGDKYTYEVRSTKKGVSTIDQLENNIFTRTQAGEPMELSEKDIEKYTGALNSVIYFATLPHKLKDDAVHKKYIEEITINGRNYDVIEITFSQEGGGEDFDDEYYYWINQDTRKIEYLAYNYQVNGGGVRFRQAFNTRVVEGITFQDYINYKAPVKTPLKELPVLFEQGKLKELSKIITENIVNNTK